MTFASSTSKSFARMSVWTTVTATRLPARARTPSTTTRIGCSEFVPAAAPRSATRNGEPDAGNTTASTARRNIGMA